MADIKALRLSLKMSQRAFARHFGMPLGTVRNWEQGIAKPPEYVFTMIEKMVRRDFMVNIETIRLMALIKELAKKSENGLMEVKQATEENKDKYIFYDSSICLDDEEKFPVVEGMIIIDDPKCYHHDVISYIEQRRSDDIYVAEDFEEVEDEDEEEEILKSVRPTQYFRAPANEYTVYVQPVDGDSNDLCLYIEFASKDMIIIENGDWYFDSWD